MQKKIYVISTQYLQLMYINLNSLIGSSRVNPCTVTHQDLKATFNASKNDCLIACDNPLDAIFMMQCLLKALPDFVPERRTLFAVPVVYAVEISESKLPQKTLLLTKDLAHYADPTPILPYEILYDDEAFFTRKERADKRRIEKKRISILLKDHAEDINIYKIDGVKLGSVCEAHFLSTDGITIKSVNLRPQADKPSPYIVARGFFSSILSLRVFGEDAASSKEAIPHKSFLI